MESASHKVLLDHSSHDHEKVSTAGFLVAIGIVFGDIGTSPLYALSAIFGDKPITETLALGGFSCIFWTLTLLTTVKYVLITLNADNRGEGGIFSLYALLNRYLNDRIKHSRERNLPKVTRDLHSLRNWILYPAMIGGGFLLADGIITPPISVSSAVEGLRTFDHELNTVPIVVVIIIMLFLMQQFGTDVIGKLFGPIMVAWFLFIGVMGLRYVLHYPEVLEALNPYYAYKLLTESPGGFWLLGSVFLCTTGAEALYSDMGHCGRGNIRLTWGFVKVCLVLSYAGQAAWALANQGKVIGVTKPFFAILPSSLVIPGIVIATMATVIASQALISGSFTLINEAIRLDLWPRFKVIYTSNFKGQIFVPAINTLLMIGCVGVVLVFQESSAMEAAYGLAVTITMVITSMLVIAYLYLRKIHWGLIAIFAVVSLSIEGAFLTANSTKLLEGGYISLGVGAVLIFVMFCWYRARRLKTKLTGTVSLDEYLGDLMRLSNDETVPKYATHLVYLTTSNSPKTVETKIMHSILNGAPKRADYYWFVHVRTTDDPQERTAQYWVMAEEDVIFVSFNLGFRVAPMVNEYFKQVVNELILKRVIKLAPPKYKIRQQSLAGLELDSIGHFRFVMLESVISVANDLSPVQKFLFQIYDVLHRGSLKEDAIFGLETSNVTIERIPVLVSPIDTAKLTSIDRRT